MYFLMMDEPFLLRLAAPLFYIKDESLSPFGWEPSLGECLFAWTIPGETALSIEPSPERFLGDLFFAGRAAPDRRGEALKPGSYFFSQVRESLGREDILFLAMEVQKEALWQRQVPEPRFYLRRLFEDNRAVTQIWRPCQDAPSR